MPTFPFVVALVVFAALTPVSPSHAARSAGFAKDAPRPWPPEPSSSSLPPEANQPEGAGDFGTPVLTPPRPAGADETMATTQAHVYGRAPSVGEDADDQDAGGIEWRIEDRRAKHKTSDLTLSLGIWPASIAGGLWAGIPVAPRGFLPSVNDAFFIEFGLLLMGESLWGEPSHSGQFDLLPALGVRWDFYLSRLVTLFGTVKLGPRIGVSPAHFAYPDPVVGIGTNLNVSKRAMLRIELNYPQGFTFGVSMPLGHTD